MSANILKIFHCCTCFDSCTKVYLDIWIRIHLTSDNIILITLLATLIVSRCRSTHENYICDRGKYKNSQSFTCKSFLKLLRNDQSINQSSVTKSGNISALCLICSPFSIEAGDAYIRQGYKNEHSFLASAYQTVNILRRNELTTKWTPTFEQEVVKYLMTKNLHQVHEIRKDTALGPVERYMG